jgi:hypothetical protein
VFAIVIAIILACTVHSDDGCANVIVEVIASSSLWQPNILAARYLASGLITAVIATSAPHLLPRVSLLPTYTDLDGCNAFLAGPPNTSIVAVVRHCCDYHLITVIVAAVDT